MNSIKGAESPVIAVTSLQRKQSVAALTLALGGGVAATFAEPPW